MSKFSKFSIVVVVLLLFTGLIAYGLRDQINRQNIRSGTNFEPTAPALNIDTDASTAQPTLSREIRVTPIGTVITRTISLTTTPVHIEQVHEDDTQ